MTPRRPKGLYDSSATRVWPVFGQLLRRDPTGLSWLSAILSLPHDPSGLAHRLHRDLTPMLPELLQKRPIGGNVLKHFGGGDVEMEACFEKTLPPSHAFLRWLIQHPERLTWPRQGRQVYSARPQTRREQLLGRRGPHAQAAAQADALAELERLGVSRAHHKWWAFEGITHVDCYLETAEMLLLVEGKRTETLSSRTDWFPARNQLLRNLEVALEIAGLKNFAVLVIAENEIDPLTPQVVERSLPHLTQPERQALVSHYLGCLRWRDVCLATGVDYQRLPETAVDWINVTSLS